MPTAPLSVLIGIRSHCRYNVDLTQALRRSVMREVQFNHMVFTNDRVFVNTTFSHKLLKLLLFEQTKVVPLDIWKKSYLCTHRLLFPSSLSFLVRRTYDESETSRRRSVSALTPSVLFSFHSRRLNMCIAVREKTFFGIS